MSENSISALRKVGIDGTGHKSQPLTQELVDNALAIFCMTEGHRVTIELSCDPRPTNVWLFREFLPDGHDFEIGDPYGGNARLYEACRDEMVEAIPSLVEFLRALAAKDLTPGKA